MARPCITDFSGITAYGPNGLRKADDHYDYTPAAAWHTLPFTCLNSLNVECTVSAHIRRQKSLQYLDSPMQPWTFAMQLQHQSDKDLQKFLSDFITLK